MCRQHRGRFGVGFDCRRHVFTADERSRGGHSAWARTMADLRLAMQLPIPEGRVWEWAVRLLAARRGE